MKKNLFHAFLLASLTNSFQFPNFRLTRLGSRRAILGDFLHSSHPISQTTLISAWFGCFWSKHITRELCYIKHQTRLSGWASSGPRMGWLMTAHRRDFWGCCLVLKTLKTTKYPIWNWEFCFFFFFDGGKRIVDTFMASSRLLAQMLFNCCLFIYRCGIIKRRNARAHTRRQGGNIEDLSTKRAGYTLRIQGRLLTSDMARLSSSWETPRSKFTYR